MNPTTFGILLYAIAHNKFELWRKFPTKEYGDFNDINLPKYFEKSINDLVISVGIIENK